MKLDFFASFADSSMQKAGGQGAFLAGVALGMLAQGQVKEGKIDTAPIFKQLTFGRLKSRDIQKHLSRTPELIKAYEIKYKEADIKGMVQDLVGRAGELLLKEDDYELGVDGNFAFTIGFINARDYFWRIFAKNQGK